MIPGELYALLQETAKFIVHAEATLERAEGGVAVMHPELLEPTIRLKDSLADNRLRLAEISGKVYESC